MKNPLRRFREDLGLSQADIAKVLGVTASSVAQYEANIPEQHLRTLADYAKKRGRREFEIEFLDLAGDPVPKAENLVVDLGNLSATESEIAATAVYIFRNPDSAYRQAVTKMLEYERTVLSSPKSKPSKAH